MNKDYLNKNEVAKLLGVKPDTFGKWVINRSYDAPKPTEKRRVSNYIVHLWSVDVIERYSKNRSYKRIKSLLDAREKKRQQEIKRIAGNLVNNPFYKVLKVSAAINA